VHSLELGEKKRRLDFFDPGAEVGEPKRIIELMLAEIKKGARDHHFHILAHPGLLPLGLRDQREKLLDAKWDEGLIDLALEYGFALEISSRWEVPGRGTIEKARRAGVRFSLGSDGHSRDRMCRLDYSLAMVKECGIGQEGLYRPRIFRRRG
jgi:histidinol phosphatase-like PHP family hydrolase